MASLECKHVVCLLVYLTALTPTTAWPASFVLESQFVGDLNIAGPGSAQVNADFSSAANITGIGMTADWTAVIADNEDGLYPWALDLRLTSTAPGGQSLVWDPIGGDVTIADYPLADFSPSYPAPQAGGNYAIEFTTPGVPNPFTSGLRNTTLYALGETNDVITAYDGSVASGPTWSRPFFIDGVSGLGPVVYDVLEFTVDVSGGYTFESVIPTGNNFNYIYQSDFDAAAPLDNLLDYGLGNGNAPNGTPQGTSRIDALLLEGETYFYVTSQFDRFSPGQDFETTITGPGELRAPTVSGDFNGDGDYACDDVDSLVMAIVAADDDPAFDLTGDGQVDGLDLDAWRAEAGAAELASGNPYLPGDADLSGTVDGADFLAWNAAKFSNTPAWCAGDFNASGAVDGEDFLLWNQFKFQSAEIAVPEPASAFTAMGIALWMGMARRRQR
ncbi:MAG: hypothetical protein AAGF97_10665 [Planctomycetota bacterium]